MQAAPEATRCIGLHHCPFTRTHLASLPRSFIRLLTALDWLDAVISAAVRFCSRAARTRWQSAPSASAALTVMHASDGTATVAQPYCSVAFHFISTCDGFPGPFFFGGRFCAYGYQCGLCAHGRPHACIHSRIGATSESLPPPCSVILRLNAMCKKAGVACWPTASCWTSMHAPLRSQAQRELSSCRADL